MISSLEPNLIISLYRNEYISKEHTNKSLQSLQAIEQQVLKLNPANLDNTQRLKLLSAFCSSYRKGIKVEIDTSKDSHLRNILNFMVQTSVLYFKENPNDNTSKTLYANLATTILKLPHSENNAAILLAKELIAILAKDFRGVDPNIICQSFRAFYCSKKINNQHIELTSAQDNNHLVNACVELSQEIISTNSAISLLNCFANIIERNQQGSHNIPEIVTRLVSEELTSKPNLHYTELVSIFFDLDRIYTKSNDPSLPRSIHNICLKIDAAHKIHADRTKGRYARISKRYKN